jgi:cysteine synthase B
MKIDHITQLIGNTPLLKIPTKVHGIQKLTLYAKLELFNPWGSVKDRSAWGMVKPYMHDLSQKVIIESSSGNTAKALQMIASLHGSHMRTITNRIRVPEVKQLLSIMGAEITELPGTSDCFDPNDPNDPSIYVERELAQNPNTYIFTDQYVTDENRRIHYETTGQEILDDLGNETVDYLVGGLGTTGSMLGTAERLREAHPHVQTIGVVAKNDDYIPGIRTKDEVLAVGLFDPAFYHEILTIDSSSALVGMLQLIKKVGLLAGPTTGASYQAAIQHFATLDRPATAIFIACDRVESYGSYITQRLESVRDNDEKGDILSTTTPDHSRAVKIEDAVDWISQHDPLLIDLRQPISFKTAHIPNSVNMPFEHLQKLLQVTNPFATSKPILFACPIGEKSAVMATHLNSLGVSAYSLEGGIVGWRERQHKLERSL